VEFADARDLPHTVREERIQRDAARDLQDAYGLYIDDEDEAMRLNRADDMYRLLRAGPVEILGDRLLAGLFEPSHHIRRAPTVRYRTLTPFV
jgi:hypothetical protein